MKMLIEKKFIIFIFIFIVLIIFGVLLLYSKDTKEENNFDFSPVENFEEDSFEKKFNQETLKTTSGEDEEWKKNIVD